MLNSICFFISERGDNPVKEFITKSSWKEQTKIKAYLEELQKQGHNLHRPMADYLGEGIYELRPSHNRIFYFFFLREKAILLHAIRKKTDKIPQGDFELCIKRKEGVENLENNIEDINL